MQDYPGEDREGEKIRVGRTGYHMSGVSRHFFLTMSDFTAPHFYGIIKVLGVPFNHPATERWDRE
jgi:hypothetical protein